MRKHGRLQTWSDTKNLAKRKVTREDWSGIGSRRGEGFPTAASSHKALLKPSASDHSKPSCFYVFISFLVLQQKDKIFILLLMKPRDRVHVIRRLCLSEARDFILSDHFKPCWFFTLSHTLLKLFLNSVYISCIYSWPSAPPISPLPLKCITSF